MSAENVETILDDFDTFSRGDLDALVPLLDPRGEWKQMK
jgi:hypothetical protein